MTMLVCTVVLFSGCCISDVVLSCYFQKLSVFLCIQYVFFSVYGFFLLLFVFVRTNSVILA